MSAVYFSTRFASSSSDPAQCPVSVAEVAFAGRSNAGKSSAINTLTRNGKLARTSRTPGRTQLINHFVLPDEERYLVDLPGYGYAAVSKARQKAWQVALTRYLTTRDSLKGLVVVMDIRHPLTDADWILIDIQQQSAAELHVLLTKADKLSRNQRRTTVNKVRDQLAAAGVEASLQDFSSLKNEGVTDIHAVLDAWLYGRELDL